MTATPPPVDSRNWDFHKELMSCLPRLRIYALSLTRNRDAADDLVQETVLKALRGRHSFQPGTNLIAWLFRIQRNEFITSIRKATPTNDCDSKTEMSLHPHQESGIVMREFMNAFSQLAATQREALVLSVLGGEKLEDIAALTGVAQGTVKSRISRARNELARMLLDEPRRPLTSRREHRMADIREDSTSAT